MQRSEKSGAYHKHFHLASCFSKCTQIAAIRVGFRSPEKQLVQLKSSMQLYCITSVSMISHPACDELPEEQTLAEPVSQGDLLIRSSVFLGPCVTRQWPHHGGSLQWINREHLRCLYLFVTDKTTLQRTDNDQLRINTANQQENMEQNQPEH